MIIMNQDKELLIDIKTNQVYEIKCQKDQSEQYNLIMNERVLGTFETWEDAEMIRHHMVGEILDSLSDDIYNITDCGNFENVKRARKLKIYVERSLKIFWAFGLIACSMYLIIQLIMLYVEILMRAL